MTIYESLAAVMADCTSVAKRDRNEHQRFMFRGIDAVVNAVGPILRKHSVTVVPTVESVQYDTVATSTGKPATACRVVVTYTFYDSDGTSLPATVAAEAWDAGDKAAPKAMSVAFRTALLQALALPTDEPDPDAATFERDHGPTPARQGRQEWSRPDSASGMSEKQRGLMWALMKQALGEGATREAAHAYASDVLGKPVESMSDLSGAEASRVIDALKSEVGE